jgi:hypothetical protein
VICGQKYHFCPRCNSDAGKPTWYHIFDGENCHDIYEVCTQYRDKEIDAETAYNLISKLDLSKIENFAESTQLQIEEIKKLHAEKIEVPEKHVEKKEFVQKAEHNANNVKDFKKK